MVWFVLKGFLDGQRAVALLALLFACPVFATAQESRADAPIPHVMGQSVSPSFEGWYPNPDGTHSLLFGYFNRNYEEKVDIPVGLNNQFTPGPADRGQPTHFLPRRQTGMFAVVVPADFEGRLTWSLTAYGETIAIPGHLRPEWEITALEEITSGNTPPVVRVHAVDGDMGQGPGGTHAAWTVPVTRAAALVVWAVDDGVRKVRASARPPRFGLVWSKYRGPGAVSFEPTTPDVDSTGQAVTMVTFDEPGEYMLRVLAWDDSGGQAAIMAGGFFCCWTNAYVTVQVQ